MGMAASQARFLGLTARKSNTEYEGQQINQQRTALSNQSANYYNQLLGMTVPVPPSVDDYTKTVFTFTDGAITNSINSMIAKQNGNYTVSYTSNWSNDFSPIAQVSHLIVTVGDDAEGEKLYNDFVGGTAGGCYSYLNDKSHDGTSNSQARNQISHIIHVVNHMLGPGTYTTSNGDTVTVNESGSIDGIYWTKPQPPYGGDAATMASIAERIEGKPIVTKLADLLFNAKDVYNNNKSNQTILNSLRDQLNNIVEIDLEKSLSANYYIGKDILRDLGNIEDVTYNTDGSINKYIGNDEYLKTLSSEQLQKTIEEEHRYMGMLNEKYGEQDWMVRYVQNTTSGEYEPNFYKRTEVKNAVYNGNNTSLSTITNYVIGSSQENKEIKGINARIEQDTSGRIINITLNPDTDEAVTYAVTTTTVTDQDKYNDAMNQYEYDKYQYDQYIQEINAKIEIVQAEDKNLELRLKQLDTEQNAIQTEMDAVEKVIQKNTESTFKTFG